jgi:hypothetical protein
MSIRKIDLLTEMRRLKRKTADARDRHTLDWAMEWAKYGIQEATNHDEVAQLERLFRLEDPRS